MVRRTGRCFLAKRQRRDEIKKARRWPTALRRCNGSAAGCRPHTPPSARGRRAHTRRLADRLVSCRSSLPSRRCGGEPERWPDLSALPTPVLARCTAFPALEGVIKVRDVRETQLCDQLLHIAYLCPQGGASVAMPH